MATHDPTTLRYQKQVRIPRTQLLTLLTRRRDPPQRGRRLYWPAAYEDDEYGSAVLLPSQFFTPPRDSHAFWRGEQRLLFAVLQDAVVCWFRCCEGRTRRERRIFAETCAWFYSEERSWLFAFARICELLDLDPDYIRSGLLVHLKTVPNCDAFAAKVCRQILSAPLPSQLGYMGEKTPPMRKHQKLRRG
ncbi:MAG: hypothetical protein AB7G75_25380 [Candidatus Binatia bacterium]